MAHSICQEVALPLEPKGAQSSKSRSVLLQTNKSNTDSHVLVLPHREACTGGGGVRAWLLSTLAPPLAAGLGATFPGSVPVWEFRAIQLSPPC